MHAKFEVSSFNHFGGIRGATEFAGQEMQDWKMTDKNCRGAK